MNKSSGLGHVVKTSKCTKKEFSGHFEKACVLVLAGDSTNSHKSAMPMCFPGK